ncbi:YcxB family protein [bacterium]|nr:YcxB family protein [bacterium]
MAYNQFVMERSYGKSVSQRLSKWLGCFLILIGLLMSLSDSGLIILAIPIFLLGLFYVFGLTLLMKVSVKANLKKLLSQGRSDTLLGDVFYQVNSEAFETKSNSGYQGSYWHALDRIEETEDHLFVFNSSISAYIVPKRELTESEFEELHSLVNEHFAEANPSQLAEAPA